MQEGQYANAPYAPCMNVDYYYVPTIPAKALTVLIVPMETEATGYLMDLQTKGASTISRPRRQRDQSEGSLRR